jgi:hypothetical protein
MLGRRPIQLHATFALVSLLVLASAGQARASEPCECIYEISGMCIPNFSCGLKKTITKYSDILVNKTVFDKNVPISFPTDGGGDSGVPKGLNIVDTGYSLLTKLGSEEPGYGLYSYAIITSKTPLTIAFMKEVFENVPAAEFLGSEKSILNILYIPLDGTKKQEFIDFRKSSAGQDAAQLAEKYMQSFYDPSMAFNILHHICGDAQGKMLDLCATDISEGPFLFTYGKPVTGLTKVPPPYLFVDLREIKEGAFRHFLSRFKEQVKREDFTDGQRISTLSNSLLNIVLTAADWIGSVKKEITDIVYPAGANATKKN